MFTINEKDGKFEILLDGSPVQMSASSREELYELASSVLQYLEFLEDPHHVSARSGKWWKIRNEVVEEQGCCLACGSNKMLNVHHIIPYAENPDLELDKNNLVCLCFTCHFLFGHLKNWNRHNSHVIKDSLWFNQRMQVRPKEDLLPE